MRTFLLVTLLACRSAPRPLSDGCIVSAQEASDYYGSDRDYSYFTPSPADIDAFQAGLGEFLATEPGAKRIVQTLAQYRGLFVGVVFGGRRSIRGVLRADRREADRAPPAGQESGVQAHRNQSLNKKLEGKLGNWNPASAVDRDIIRSSRERIEDEDLPDDAALATMRSPIKQDGLLLALYTGLRSEDVRTMRFDQVDWDDETLHLPNPKGGPDAAFTIPLSKTPLQIPWRRKDNNAKDLGRADDGWTRRIKNLQPRKRKQRHWRAVA